MSKTVAVTGSVHYTVNMTLEKPPTAVLSYRYTFLQSEALFLMQYAPVIFLHSNWDSNPDQAVSLITGDVTTRPPRCDGAWATKPVRNSLTSL